jgi:LysR family hca operon transcriptional activator
VAELRKIPDLRWSNRTSVADRRATETRAKISCCDRCRSDHRLAKQKAVDPQDFVGETYVGVSNTPRVLRAIIGDYFKRRGIEIVPTLEIDNYAMAISLVASRRGVALLPISAENFLPWSVVSRPLKGEVPTIDLVIGYHKANASPILKTFLSRIEDLTARLSATPRRPRG